MRIYESFNEWWECAKSAAIHLAKGLYRLAEAIVIGLVSLLCALWRLLSKAVGRYPSVALTTFLFAVFMAWLLTFMTMRARAVGAEAQRDSLSWEYSQLKENLGSEKQ